MSALVRWLDRQGLTLLSVLVGAVLVGAGLLLATQLIP